jgi:hypothetical protein
MMLDASGAQVPDVWFLDRDLATSIWHIQPGNSYPIDLI